ncbi:MAG: type II toxin-antitoxin system Phd/YefM family antitoxin [Acidimicrobiia bacterium]
MIEITATDAARAFSDLLDAVEHGGEEFTILRRGRAVARVEPVARSNGAEVKAFLARHEPDPEWLDDLHAVRDLLEVQPRR